MTYLLTFAAAVLLIAAACGLFRLAAVGRSKTWAHRRDMRALVTPEVRPANPRPQDFDDRGRPW